MLHDIIEGITCRACGGEPKEPDRPEVDTDRIHESDEV